MNKKLFQSTLLVILLFCLLFESNGQCDYQTNRFGFGLDKKILYGVLPDYRGIPDSLFLDIYFPVGSPEVEKPLIVWAFGGGFFQGKREDFSVVCQEMAKKGIVSATIDYRLGFDGPNLGFGPPFSFDAAEILRAGYRGATDMKGAIRFLKAKQAEYGIDLDRIWVGGASAGAVVALNAAFLNKDSDKPKECGEWTPVGTKPRPDLGPIDGVLNQNGFDSKVQGVFNFFGALLDTLAVDADDKIAVFSYHQKDDPVVPCQANQPYYPIPLIAQNYPVAYGSCVLTERFEHLNLDPLFYETWIYQGAEHAIHNEQAVFDFMLTHARPHLCKEIIANQDVSDSSLSLFPNPVYDYLSISGLKGQTNYIIRTISGAHLVSGICADGQTISVSDLNPGLYLIELQAASLRKSLKWIKY